MSYILRKHKQKKNSSPASVDEDGFTATGAFTEMGLGLLSTVPPEGEIVALLLVVGAFPAVVDVGERQRGRTTIFVFVSRDFHLEYFIAGKH